MAGDSRSSSRVGGAAAIISNARVIQTKGNQGEGESEVRKGPAVHIVFLSCALRIASGASDSDILDNAISP